MPSSMDKEKECKVCSRRFSNGKALGGHMRSHSPKMRNSVHPASASSISSNLQSYAGDNSPDNQAEMSTCISSLEEDAALCLLMMNTDGRTLSGSKDWLTWNCKKCKKGFSSYQALGGHNASHSRMESYQHNKVFKCSLCPRVFASGQALGGHMKVHNNNNVSNSHLRRFAKPKLLPLHYGDYDHEDEESFPNRFAKPNLLPLHYGDYDHEDEELSFRKSSIHDTSHTSMLQSW